MKLRMTILLLAGVLLVLCAASQPQPNAENPRDARKIRYAQRKELVNQQKASSEDAAPSATSDPNAPLSLLPAGAEVPKGEDRPNQAPLTDDLTDGVTAAASLDTAPADSGSETSSVRSLAIDGAPFGEVRKVVKQQPTPQTEKPPQVLAAAQPKAAIPQKAAGGPPAITDTKLAMAGKPLKVKQPAKVAAEDKLLASDKAPKQGAQVPKLNPVAAKTLPGKAAPAAAKPKAEPLLDMSETAVETASSAIPENSEDHARLLDKYLNKDLDITGRSTDDVRSGGAPAVASDDTALEASGGELLASKPELDEAQLDPLGVPGEKTIAAAPSRLRGWLFGLCGLFALGAIVVALPRPRVAAKSDDGLTLIESIALAEGRELVILRKKHYALALGVTKQATHLLEKVSMASLDSDYNSVINTIIKRESETPELWRMRPLFSANYRTDYAPEERAAPSRRTSLSEMRSGLQVVGPSRVTATPAVRASISELRQREVPSVAARSRTVDTGKASREAVIRRIREQARRAS
jgi:hypothetical protein